ncbi:hypothetical protein BC828DRAFT_412446 [Blastocladiella britannica]|nr:hypothetical protein BC828DRAFT_412446 [Blastocladiella britannica]
MSGGPPPATTAWFHAARTADIQSAADLVATHGSYLLGLQDPSPIQLLLQQHSTSTAAADFTADCAALLGNRFDHLTGLHLALVLLAMDAFDGLQSSVASMSSSASISTAASTSNNTNNNINGSSSNADAFREFAMHLIQMSDPDHLRLRWGQGNTALHLAAYIGDHALIELLLAKTEAPHVRNDLNFAAIDVALDQETVAAFKRAASPKSEARARRAVFAHHSDREARDSGSYTGSVANVYPGDEEDEEDVEDPNLAPLLVASSPTMPTKASAAATAAKSATAAADSPTRFTGKYLRSTAADGTATAAAAPFPTQPNSEPAAAFAKPTTKPQVKIAVAMDLSSSDDSDGDDDNPAVHKPVIPPTTTAAAAVAPRSPGAAPATPSSIASLLASPTKSVFIGLGGVKKPAAAATATATIPAKPASSIPVAVPIPVVVKPTAAVPVAKHAAASAAIPAAKQTPTSDPDQAAATAVDPSLVDRASVDFGNIRARFAQMVQANPDIPKNPNEKLADIHAKAASNGTVRSWKPHHHSVPSTAAAAEQAAAASAVVPAIATPVKAMEAKPTTQPISTTDKDIPDMEDEASVKYPAAAVQEWDTTSSPSSDEEAAMTTTTTTTATATVDVNTVQEATEKSPAPLMPGLLSSIDLDFGMNFDDLVSDMMFTDSTSMTEPAAGAYGGIGSGVVRPQDSKELGGSGGSSASKESLIGSRRQSSATSTTTTGNCVAALALLQLQQTQSATTTDMYSPRSATADADVVVDKRFSGVPIPTSPARPALATATYPSSSSNSPPISASRQFDFAAAERAAIHTRNSSITSVDNSVATSVVYAPPTAMTRSPKRVTLNCPPAPASPATAVSPSRSPTRNAASTTPANTQHHDSSESVFMFRVKELRGLATLFAKGMARVNVTVAQGDRVLQARSAHVIGESLAWKSDACLSASTLGGPITVTVAVEIPAAKEKKQFIGARLFGGAKKSSSTADAAAAQQGPVATFTLDLATVRARYPGGIEHTVALDDQNPSGSSSRMSLVAAILHYPGTLPSRWMSTAAAADAIADAVPPQYYEQAYFRECAYSIAVGQESHGDGAAAGAAWHAADVVRICGWELTLPDLAIDLRQFASDDSNDEGQARNEVHLQLSSARGAAFALALRDASDAVRFRDAVQVARQTWAAALVGQRS